MMFDPKKEKTVFEFTDGASVMSTLEDAYLLNSTCLTVN